MRLLGLAWKSMCANFTTSLRSALTSYSSAFMVANVRRECHGPLVRGFPHQGQDYPDAVPLVLHHDRHRDVPAPDPAPAEAPTSGLNDAALLAAQAAQRPQGVQYGPPVVEAP